MPIANGVDPCDFVIFGGTGDLAVRKLLPALYLRDRDGQLTADTRVIAVARAGLDEPGYRHKIQAELGRFVAAELLDGDTVDRFLARLRFVSIDLTEPSDYAAVTDVLAASAVDIRVFYLACAPALFGPICDALGRQGLVTTSSRVVLEKPIGHDLASAQAINDAVGAVFEERQIFRIDHYLGKESVQNLLVTRFANTLLEPLWNSSWIDHVQITAAESLGVGTRGDYYDKSGALRDMLQNHLLQVLCLVAMEPPTYIDRETVRDEKLKVLQALKPLSAKDIKRDTVTGQYGPGLADGAVVGAYRAGRRKSGQLDRDVRSGQGRDQQLALGRGAVLSAHRQADVAAVLRDRRPVQTRSAADVSRQRRRIRAEPAGDLAAAGRGDAPRAHRERTWARRHPDAAGVTGAQLHRGLSASLTRRLRATADGCRAR